MGLLEDIMKTLERVPGWKRIAGMPDEVDKLKVRLEALEARLTSPSGEICPSCRAPEFRIISNRPMPHFEWAGKSLNKWKCNACDYQVEKPATQ